MKQDRESKRLQKEAELAKRIAEDTDKQKRLAEQNCKCCFYGSRIGGAAI